MIYKLSMIMILLLTFTSEMSARNFYEYKKLQDIANATGLNEITDTLPDGEYVGKLTYNNHPVSVSVDKGIVKAIGFSIFSVEQAGVNTTVRHFIERYMLEAETPGKRIKSFDRQMYEDDFRFIKGSRKVLLGVYDDADISLNYQTDFKSVNIAWSRNGALLCSLSFPLNYELLYGTDLVECQNILLKNLKNLPESEPIPDSVDNSILEKLFEPNYYIAKGGSFIVDQLNNNRYYRQTSENEYELLFSKRFLIESLANLFNTNGIENNLTLDLKVVLYDFRNENITIDLTSALSYFKSCGCKCYFGVIACDNEKIISEVLLANSEEGYCHIIRLTSDLSNIESRQGHFAGRMNCFIPLSKIRMIFQENLL